MGNFFYKGLDNKYFISISPVLSQVAFLTSIQFSTKVTLDNRYMNERHCVNKVNFIYKNKGLIGFGPWVNLFHESAYREFQALNKRS